jgi:hypothetical protein
MPSAGAIELSTLLERSGAEVLVENGGIVGEVLGLEVARVVDDARGARLEVGVGRHDREAFGLLHGDEPVADAVARVLDEVRRHRRPGSDAHPLALLAQERWLRRTLLDDPGRIGAAALEPVEPAFPRSSVRAARPAGAIGTDQDGHTLLVVCSVGIDLDLVPEAGDLALRHGLLDAAAGARILVVVPERDDHPVTRLQAAALLRPADVIALPGDWRR